MLRRHGKTPIELLSDFGILGPDFIAGHSIFVSGHSFSGYADPWDKDIRLLAENKSTVAHCPIVFSRYGFALESYSKYKRMGEYSDRYRYFPTRHTTGNEIGFNPLKNN